MTDATISREQDYYAFEAEAVAKYGTMVEAWDVKYTLDINLALANVTLNAAIAGMKIDAKLAPVTFAIDNGIRMPIWTAVFENASFNAKAELAKSRIMLSEVTAAAAEIEVTTARLCSTLASVEQRVVAIKTGLEVSV